MCCIRSLASRGRPRRFPKGDRKALWSRPQARNLRLQQSNRLKREQYQSPFSKRKSREPIGSLLYGIRRRPMLPGRVQPSTFGTERLNFCVRDGNRWDPLVIATGNGELFTCGESRNEIVSSFPRCSPHPDNCTAMILTDRFQLVSLLDSALNQALDRLVSSSSIRYRTSTDDLSTW